MLSALLRYLRRAPPPSRSGLLCKLEGDVITIAHVIHGETKVRLADLDEIGIETTDTGPFLEDVFWLLKSGQHYYRVPQESHVFKELFDRFHSLQGFDWDPFSEAMCCTDKAYFLCWRRNQDVG